MNIIASSCIAHWQCQTRHCCIGEIALMAAQKAAQLVLHSVHHLAALTAAQKALQKVGHSAAQKVLRTAAH